MFADAPPVELLGTMTKHQIAGTVAVVIGAILILLGVTRVVGRAASGAFVPIVGAVLVIIGILLFARVV